MAKHRCPYCREYDDKENMFQVGASSFCNRDHFYEHQKGKKNRGQAVRRATEARRRNDGVSEDLHERILFSDGYRCRYCGRYRGDLAVHHVIYKSDVRNRPFQDQPSNLLTLCNTPCHLQIIHGDKHFYQPLCLQIIWLRETKGDKYTTIKRLENDN